MTVHKDICMNWEHWGQLEGHLSWSKTSSNRSKYGQIEIFVRRLIAGLLMETLSRVDLVPFIFSSSVSILKMKGSRGHPWRQRSPEDTALNWESENDWPHVSILRIRTSVCNKYVRTCTKRAFLLQFRLAFVSASSRLIHCYWMCS